MTGPYEHMKAMYGGVDGLVSKAKELGYKDENILILKGQEDELKSQYSECNDNIQSCRHNRDTRTPMEYAQDLVASWIFEDSLVKEMNKVGCQMFLSGADKERVILRTGKVSSKSDTYVQCGDKKLYAEIMTDYKGWWQKNKSLELRDDKYGKIKSEDGILLGISASNNQYLILDFQKPLDVKHIDSYKPYGWKPAASIKLDSIEQKPLDFGEIAKDIAKICGE